MGAFIFNYSISKNVARDAELRRCHRAALRSGLKQAGSDMHIVYFAHVGIFRWVRFERSTIGDS